MTNFAEMWPDEKQAEMESFPSVRASSGELKQLLAELAQAEGDAWQTTFRRVLKYKQHAAVPGLLALLETTEPQYANSLAQAISTIGGKDACPGLVRIAQTVQFRAIRLAAIYGLTWLFDDEAFEPLLAAFVDPHEDAEIRAQAAEGLALLSTQTADESERRRVAVRAFLNGLEGDEPELIRRSVHALGSLGIEAALPGLRRIAADPLVRADIQADAADSIALITASPE